MTYTFESQLDAGAFLWWLGRVFIPCTVTLGPPVSVQVGLAYREGCDEWLSEQEIAHQSHPLHSGVTVREEQ